MKLGNRKSGTFFFTISLKTVFVAFFAMCLFLASTHNAYAFQNSKKNRIVISKKDRTQKRKQRADSLKVLRSQKPEKAKKSKKPFKLGKPVFHGVLSGFRFLPEENADSDINFSAGLEVSFKPIKRLEFFAGIGLNYIDQNYKIEEEVVQGRLNNGALLLREHVSTDIFVLGLELPIGLRYRLKDASNSWVVSFGFTTRTSIKEKYEDFINWQTGGLNGNVFIASSQRETSIFNESPEAFEFLNVFSSGFLGLGKSFRVDEEHNAEIQLTYHFNVAGVKNIFQEVRFKKYESLGITLKYPLRFDRWFK